MELAMIMAFLKQMFGSRSFFPKFFAALTVIWLIVEPIAVFKEVPNSWYCYAALIVLSFISAVIWNWPRTIIKHRFKHNDLTVRVRKGNVLSAQTNIVIGFCDTFDTEIGRIIKDNSLQGQFQHDRFQGDVAKLDKMIDELLEPEKRFAIHDPEKRRGKHLRFPIGTTLALDQGKQFFLLVYATMGNDLAIVPTPAADITTALFKLWDCVRRCGQNDIVAVPIIGSGPARTGLSRIVLVKMIMLTFFTSHATNPITKGLDIYVHPSDMEHVDFNAIKLFLKSI